MQVQHSSSIVSDSPVENEEQIVIRNKARQLNEWLSDVDIITYVLIMLFALSSWIDINGLWVEVPLLVNELPEKWSLPSFIVIIIQIANIGPLMYTIARKFAPKVVHEVPVVYVIIGVGAASTLLLVHFWDRTSHIMGKEHSTALLTLTGFLSLVDCTSSVVYLPFMQRFKPQYMSALYIGEGLSGLIPGFVGLAQGVGGNPVCVNSSDISYNSSSENNSTTWNVYPVYPPPRFSVEIFFWMLFTLLCVSCAAFTLVNYLPRCQKAHARIYTTGSCSPATDSRQYDAVTQIDSSACLSHHDVHANSNEPCSDDVAEKIEKAKTFRAEAQNGNLKRSENSQQQLCLLLMTGWVCAWTNAVIPSTQTFSCLPYGRFSMDQYKGIDKTWSD